MNGRSNGTRRRDLIVAVLLLLVAAGLRLPRLGFPPEEFFDEVYHAKTARQFLQGEAPTEWVHPPTAKILIASGIAVFGYEPWAWRLAPALAGIALAPVFFFLARGVLETRRAAILASILLMCDGVYLVQSRTAMTNIFAILFQVATTLLAVKAVRETRLSALTVVGLGVFLGLAVSTRWTSLWAWGFAGLVLLVARRGAFFRPRELGLAAVAFVVLPALVYVGSYAVIPEWSPHLHKGGLKQLWELQKGIWAYHANLNATHPYFSKWYTWPWLYRPTWYFYDDKGGIVRGIFAVGNPALWWLSVPVSVWAIVSGAVRKDPRRLFTGAGFFAMYLPWGISPRTLNYSHYLFEAIPYACLSLGAALDRLWDDDRWRLVARAYVALVVGLFVLFLPLLTGMAVPSRWFYARLGGMGAWTWFRSWI